MINDGLTGDCFFFIVIIVCLFSLELANWIMKNVVHTSLNAKKH